MLRRVLLGRECRKAAARVFGHAAVLWREGTHPPGCEVRGSLARSAMRDGKKKTCKDMHGGMTWNDR